MRRREEDYRLFRVAEFEGIFREELADPIPLTLAEDEIISRIRHDAYITECDDALAEVVWLQFGKEMTEASRGDADPG